jgi:hypothetical protein
MPAKGVFRNGTPVLARNVMKFDDFRQALRTLFTLELHELVQAGAIAREDYQTWRTFKIDPLRWFLIADDRTAQAVWVAIERRRRGVATVRAAGGNHPIVARFVPRNAHRG